MASQTRNSRTRVGFKCLWSKGLQMELMTTSLSPDSVLCQLPLCPDVFNARNWHDTQGNMLMHAMTYSMKHYQSLSIVSPFVLLCVVSVNLSPKAIPPQRNKQKKKKGKNGRCKPDCLWKSYLIKPLATIANWPRGAPLLQTHSDKSIEMWSISKRWLERSKQFGQPK